MLRPHESDGAIVLDAAVRSWPPIDPLCLRWNFPVWTPDEDLDPTQLRNESRKRRAKGKETKDQPKPTVVIMTEAKQAGLSQRKPKDLIKQAEATGLIHRWRFASNKPVEYARRPQENPAQSPSP